MGELVVVTSQNDRMGQAGVIPEVVKESLDKGIGLAKNSFLPYPRILLGGWKVHCNGSLITLHTAMELLMKKYHDVRVIKAVFPRFGCGETYGERCYWEAATILLTARSILAEKIEIVYDGLDDYYMKYIPVGFSDYEVNNPWVCRKPIIKYYTCKGEEYI